MFRKDGVLHIADARVDEYAEEERKSQPLRLLERLGVPLKVIQVSNRANGQI